MIQEISVTPTQLQVALSGCIYAAESTTIQEQLGGYIERGHNRISMDFSNVEYIDCMGLGTLVFINERIRKRGGRISICGLQGRVKRLFELTRLEDMFCH